MINIDLEKTGQFLPVYDYVDLTTGQSLPEDPEPGARVLTKEIINPYGVFYTKDEMRSIIQKLNEADSGWRVASEDDWNQMLNAIECAEYRNHSHEPLNEFLGKDAGKILKSQNVWNDDDNPETEGLTQFDFEVLPTEENEAKFWTATKFHLTDEYYVKVFSNESSGVKNESSDQYTLASIRLVKDYDGSNFLPYEEILGQYYKATLITSLHEEVNYAKIWTAINFNYTDDLITGAVDANWELERINYIINEWDGEHWQKKLLTDGCKVVVIYSNDDYVEYMIAGDDLVDTSDELHQVSDQTNALRLFLESLNNAQNKRELERKINTLFGDGAAVLLKEYILSVLEGIGGEIKLKREDGKIYFGFDDNAIFGPK